MAEAGIPSIVRIGRGFDEALRLEALDEGRGGCARHTQLAGDVARPGAVRPAEIHGRHHGVGPLREPKALVGAIPGALDGLPGGNNRIGELEGELRPISHQPSAIGRIIVNMLIVNIRNICVPAIPGVSEGEKLDQQVSDQSTFDSFAQRRHFS